MLFPFSMIDSPNFICSAPRNCLLLPGPLFTDPQVFQHATCMFRPGFCRTGMQCPFNPKYSLK